MIKLKSGYSIVLFSILLLHGENVYTQAVKPTLNIHEISVAIDSINNKLQKNYIFPKVADEMAKRLNENLKNGNYRSLTDPTAFAVQLTKDLQAVAHDK